MGKKIIALSASLILLSALTVFGTISHAQSESANVKVEKVSNSSVAHGLKERVEVSWPWYVSRASGIVAAVTLVILMLSGIGLITGHTFSFLEPITAWASHRALGIAFLVSVLLHTGALFFDNFVPFSLVDLLVPFASDFKPTVLLGLSVGSLYVALGVISLYIVIAVVLTSLLWVEKKPTIWKLTHLLSYLAMIFVFVHGLYLGTDFSSGLGRVLWIILAVIVLGASISRLWRAKTV
ncbi:ferric reductase-like transmembrane domain-containing protein [Candidatus Woesebacteria bacterium]|jgi:predicted ferric reductase|nr:ferric reductase-like transmembrane domain-containing protein [Candidatus Woesebacteria bacterium]